MIDLSTLNPPQRECVTTLKGPVTLLAGAGTGKTRVITFRIANMIGHGIDPRAITAVTFTNKAAKEMRERVTSLVGPKARSLFVGTFHSFCLKILRDHNEAAGISRQFQIAGTSDQIDVVRKCLEEKGWEGQFRPDIILNAISHAKNQLWDEEAMAKHIDPGQFQNYDPAVLVETFGMYQRRLLLYRHIDFDDCIYLCVRMLQSYPDIIPKLGVEHMLVDEFQDTNYSQLMLIKELCKKHRNICVVGDDDQSIYSWRGAMSSVLTNFEEVFEERKLIKLEQNYRCTNIILDAANKVIKNNTQRKEKKLWSDSKSQTPITIGLGEDEIEEARWIAKRCSAFMSKGYKPRDIGILYRTNGQTKLLEMALREYHVPYKVFGGQSFFERKEMRDLVAYLKLVANRKDRLAFWRIINVPSRGFGLKSLEDIERVAKTKRCTPFEVLERHLDLLPARVHASARSFVDGISDLSRGNTIRGRDDLVATLRTIIKRYNLEGEIRKKSSTQQIALAKIDSLRRVPEWLGEFADYHIQENGHFVLREFLDDLSLGEHDRKVEHQDAQYASLMTIHAAKGLEFPIVFVAGLEEGLLPHRNSTDVHEQIAEERRLFYVAITRAKEKLHLSRALERGNRHGDNRSKASRFLDELPEEGIIRAHEEEAEKLDEASRRSRTLGKLSNLRQSLSNRL